MAKPYVPTNEVQGALTSDFVHGTDNHLHLVSAADFDTGGGYIRVQTTDGAHWALYEYTAVSTNDLTGLTPCTLGVVETDAAYTFTAGAYVYRVCMGEDIYDRPLGPGAAVTDNTVVLFDGTTSRKVKAATASSTTTHALFATAGAPAFRAIVAGDAGFAATQTTAAMDIYVDATDGDDGNAGTIGAPLKTFNAAVALIPTIINHVVTIHLTADAGTYTAGTLKNRVAGSVDGEIIIEGALTVAVSGAITARADDQNDPVYAANAPVDRLTVTEDLTAADAQQYKLLRVYKAGETDIYRIITGNTDGFVGDSYIYVSHLFGTNPVDDDTWSYSINTWGARIASLTLGNLYVPVTIRYIRCDQVSYAGDLPSVGFYYCYGEAAQRLHQGSPSSGKISLTDSYFYDTGEQYVVIIEAGFINFQILGTILRGGISGVYLVGGSYRFWATYGSRILDVSGNAIHVANARGTCWSNAGRTVLDDDGAGIGFYLRNASSLLDTGATHVHNACATASDAADATVFDALS